MADASFNTVNDSMSSGSKLLKLRSTPSTKISGLELCPTSVDIPLIQISELSCPGSPVRCTATTPAIRPEIAEERFPVGIFISFRFREDCAPTTEIFRCCPKPTTTASSISATACSITMSRNPCLTSFCSWFLYPTCENTRIEFSFVREIR
ncbi:hypothetical protein D3C86_1482090 [compost metagenome]